MMTSVTRQLMLVVFVMGCLIGKGAMASPCTGFLNCANIKPVHTLTKNRINIYKKLRICIKIISINFYTSIIILVSP